MILIGKLLVKMLKKRREMKKYILMFAVVAVMSACTEYPDVVPTPDVPKDIYTTLEAEAGEDISRTTLDGTDGISIHWNAGDQK